MKAKILDMQGQVINPDPPSGLYVGGSCPVCNAPLFYHGGGQHIQEHPAGPNTFHPIPEQVFDICDCPKDGVPVDVPDGYNLLAERQAIMLIFSAYNQLRSLNHELAVTLQEMTEELKERVETIAGVIEP